MDFYKSLGITSRINAAACYTALGGSLMSAQVLAAMNSAAKSFISLHELQQKAGEKIAKITNNEAAYITTGAAAGIVLSVLATRNRGNLIEIQKIIDGTAKESEVLMFTGHRIPYDAAIRLAGSKIVTVGDAIQTFEYQLEAGINQSTSAILYCAGSHLAAPVLSLEKTIKIAKQYGIPVIVDAAAQLPPLSNLWHFSRDSGADLVIFSGGKGLRGPQSSGLIVGTHELIEAVRANGAPFQRLGRAFKASKEEIAGLVTAIEIYVEKDHEEEWKIWSKVVELWVDELSKISDIKVSRDDVNEAGQPIPRVAIELPSEVALKVVDRLQNLDPIVEVVHDSRKMIWISPDSLEPGQEIIVVEQLKKVLPFLEQR